MSRLTLSLLACFALTAPSAFAQDFSNVKSGMLLGVYATPSHNGMRVSSTIPGYSADGRLFSGDVLLRVTIDGFTMYQTRTNYELENAKIAIGPNREAAIEFWRPGVGLMYAWVEFTPISAPAAAFSVKNAPSKAMFKLESEKPGARLMFQKNLGNPGGPILNGPATQGPKPLPLPVIPPKSNGPKNPADLFN